MGTLLLITSPQNREISCGMWTTEEVSCKLALTLPQAGMYSNVWFDYGQLWTIELRHYRDLAPEEDMPANAIIFSQFLYKVHEHIQPRYAQTIIGWANHWPYVSDCFVRPRQMNSNCTEDVYDVVRNSMRKHFLIGWTNYTDLWYSALFQALYFSDITISANTHESNHQMSYRVVWIPPLHHPYSVMHPPVSGACKIWCLISFIYY